MPKILVIEDDKFLIKVYGARLQKDDVEVVMLESGRDALETAKKEKPNVIALDIVMPGKNGFEVLKELQEDPETKNIPVVMVTALNSNQDREKALSLGAKEYLVKTDYSFKEIQEKLAAYL